MTLTRQGLKDFLDGAGVEYSDDASKHVLESLVRKLSIQDSAPKVVESKPKEEVIQVSKRVPFKELSPKKGD